MNKDSRLQMLLSKINAAANALPLPEAEIFNVTDELSYCVRGGLNGGCEEGFPNVSCPGGQPNPSCNNNGCNSTNNPENTSCTNQSCGASGMSNTGCTNAACS